MLLLLLSASPQSVVQIVCRSSAASVGVFRCFISFSSLFVLLAAAVPAVPVAVVGVVPAVVPVAVWASF